MKGQNKLHDKISSQTITFLFTAITLLSIVIFYVTHSKIKNEYLKRLEMPGKLIEKKVVSYEIINNRDFIASLVREDIVQCVIIGRDGKIYYSTTKSHIGKDSWEIDGLHLTSRNNKNIKLTERVKDRLNYFTNIKKLYNENKEELGHLFIKTKKLNFKTEIWRLLFLFFIGVVAILFLVYIFLTRLINKKIISPLEYLIDSSKELNQGNLSFALKKVNSNDEFEILEGHNNQFVLGLREKTKFADEIEKKNFNYEYKPLSEKDELGKALVELRNSLKKATEEEEIRKKLDEVNSWITSGVARFSEILRKDIENMEQLGYSVISNLVDYLEANQGGFFLIEEDENNEKVIELKAAYALNRKKHFERKLSWGEGIIGSTLLEGKLTYLTNIPEDYINISSGLGESKPRSLLIVPLQSGDIKYGALELASFKPFDEHHLDLVNRISEIIASTISTVRNNIQTQKLLKETQEQSEKIRQAEEELRQNIEEMHATQEEVERTNNELRKNELELKQKAEELAKEKYLMDALMGNVPEFIYFKDKESKFIKNSKSHASIFGHDDPAQIVGKSDFDFFSDEHARPAFDDEQKIIETEQPIIDLIEKETHDDGSVTWVTTTKMPLRNQEGIVVGTFGISKDITAIKELEQEAIKSKERLEFENLLFTTLMDNIAARVTYKDTGARYIRINETKVKALGIKDQKEVLGKTDIDIFGDSHGKEVLKKEIENIGNALSVYDHVELIKYKDGHLSWGSTSRIPLKNKEGKILGGLVITWDITERKNAAFELEVNNTVLDSLFKELDIIYFNLDKDKRVTSVKGRGMETLKIPLGNEGPDQFLKLFPDILKSVNKMDKKEKIALSETRAIENVKFEIKHVIIVNKMTTNGFTGYTILNKV